MDSKMLLVGSTSNRRWIKALRKVIHKLDKSLEVVSQSDLEHMSWTEYALILLDASVLGDLSTVIKRIHLYSPDIRIVVFSSAPGWKEAKEVLLAGATDYERKSLVEENILSSLRRNL